MSLWDRSRSVSLWLGRAQSKKNRSLIQGCRRTICQIKTLRGLFMNIHPRFHVADCCTSRWLRTHPCLAPEMVTKTTRASSKDHEVFMLHVGTPHGAAYSLDRWKQHPDFCRLVVLAINVCRRRNPEKKNKTGSHNFPTAAGPSEARERPQPDSFTNVLIHRWSAQIAHAGMTAYAASLLEVDCVASAVTNGNGPFTAIRWPKPASLHQPPLGSSSLDLALPPCIPTRPPARKRGAKKTTKTNRFNDTSTGPWLTTHSNGGTMETSRKVKMPVGTGEDRIKIWEEINSGFELFLRFGWSRHVCLDYLPRWDPGCGHENV